MISIIIPVYNRANLIKETLDSIKLQTYTNWECIIVDDGSIDDTIGVIKKTIECDIRFKIFKRPIKLNKGPSSCRNYGVSLCSGKYIQFFDSDDIMHPDHLKLKREGIKTNDFVICHLKSFSGDFNTNLYEITPSSSIEQNNNLLEDFACGAFSMMMVAPMWKSKIIKSYLPIREDLHILEDHELYVRVLSHPKTYAVINRVLIFNRIGSESSTSSFYKKVSYGLDSYFKAKQSVLQIISTPKVKLSILKMTLSIFRRALIERDFKSASSCINYVKNQDLCYNFWLKIKFLRIYLFFNLFKLIKRGDTMLKPFFKI